MVDGIRQTLFTFLLAEYGPGEPHVKTGPVEGITTADPDLFSAGRAGQANRTGIFRRRCKEMSSMIRVQHGETLATGAIRL